MPDSVPLVLAFDTSLPHCAATLLKGDEVLASTEEPMVKGQAERLLGLCQDLLALNSLRFQDLDAVGVCTGPGNFTGIRISVAAARGLALPLGIPAIGVDRFDALHLGQTAPCLCAVDAKRNQVYLKGYGVPDFETPCLLDRDALADFSCPVIGDFGAPSTYGLAEATARLAKARFETPSAPPKPTYLRPADAAPARDAPPALVP